MMIFLRNFTRHIRDGFRNLFRNGWMTVASLIVMILTLFTLGSLMFIMSNVDNITNDIEAGVNIRVHIDLTATEEQIDELGEAIKQIQDVEQVTYRSKEDELDELVESIEEFKLVFGDNNPLYNVFLVSVRDNSQIEPVANEIKQLPYAKEVNYGEIDTENLLQVLNYIRIGMAFASAVLVVIALVVISNTIRITIEARQTEIEIMQLVGAHRRYVRAPFIYEGAFIGLFGGAVASGCVYLAYQALHNVAIEYNDLRLLQLTPMWPLMSYIIIVLLISGILLGILGARRSVGRLIE